MGTVSAASLRGLQQRAALLIIDPRGAPRGYAFYDQGLKPGTILKSYWF